MPVSLDYSATTPSARSCAWVSMSIARPSAIRIDGCCALRANTDAIDAHRRQTVATTSALVNDFESLFDPRGLLGIADDACSPQRSTALSNPVTRNSPGLIVRHHALLPRRRTLPLMPKRAPVSFIEPLGQP